MLFSLEGRGWATEIGHMWLSDNHRAEAVGAFLISLTLEALELADVFLRQVPRNCLRVFFGC